MSLNLCTDSTKDECSVISIKVRDFCFVKNKMVFSVNGFCVDFSNELCRNDINFHRLFLSKGLTIFHIDFPQDNLESFHFSF